MREQGRRNRKTENSHGIHPLPASRAAISGEKGREPMRRSTSGTERGTETKQGTSGHGSRTKQAQAGGSGKRDRIRPHQASRGTSRPDSTRAGRPRRKPDRTAHSAKKTRTQPRRTDRQIIRDGTGEAVTMGRQGQASRAGTGRRTPHEPAIGAIPSGIEYKMTRQPRRRQASKKAKQTTATDDRTVARKTDTGKANEPRSRGATRSKQIR